MRTHFYVIQKRLLALSVLALVVAVLVRGFAALGVAEALSFAIAAFFLLSYAAFESIKGKAYSLGMSHALVAFFCPAAFFAIDEVTGGAVPEYLLVPAAIFLIVGFLYMFWALFLRSDQAVSTHLGE